MEQVPCPFGENDLSPVPYLDGPEKMFAFGRNGHMGFFLVVVDQCIHGDIVKLR